MFANLGLAKKLAVGFGFILVLLCTVGAISYTTLHSSSEGFDNYRDTARHANLMGGVEANLLLMRLQVKDYILTGNSQELDHYREYREKSSAFMEAARQEIREPKRAQLIQETDKQLRAYDQAFQEVIGLMERRNQLVRDGLDKTGPETEQQLSEILLSAKKDDDMAAAYFAALATRDLLLMRLQATKFLDTNAPETVEQLSSHAASLSKSLELLQKTLKHPRRQELLALATQGFTSYRDTFAQTVQIIKRRNGLIHDRLDALGPEIAEHIESIRLNIKNEQDQLGPALQAANHRAVAQILGLVALALVGGIGATLIIVRGITRPVRDGLELARQIALGDFSHRLTERSRDEIGTLITALNTMAQSLARNAEAAVKIAEGDLDVEVSLASEKDQLGLALQRMVDGLNNSLGQVQMASQQIACAADEISDASQALSQGATESASSLEEISSSLDELASQTTMNAENANQANLLAASASQAAQKGDIQMQAMVAAMDEINASSQSISKIIKTIDEIAFQTNLLALNAAVEAARAGQHGKGFAVVAEEVRNLAARSAKAAQETTHLIEGSVQKTSNGSAIATQTAEALKDIVSGVSKVTDLVGEISIASKEQADGVNQINIGISQIDQVTQQNTASAEQTAAASEELSGQALQMEEMVGQFRLRKQLSMRAPQPLLGRG
ncbi:MAG: HAMP domain-containing protein [Desulfuromonadaceae bacterium]|nr:HAMP domain-containing protein [Desulfuromonadaceae bacterium]